MTWTAFIAPGVALILAAIGGFIAYGKMSARLTTMALEIAELRGSQRTLRERGPARYISADECAAEHSECKLEVCHKIDVVFQLLAEGDKKRDAARAEFIASMNLVHKFIGRVDEYIRLQDSHLRNRRFDDENKQS